MDQAVENMTIEGQGQPERGARPFRHLTVRSFDPDTNLFHLQSESKESRLGVCLRGYPLSGADERMMQRLKSVLTAQMPVDTFIQFGIFSDPDVSANVNAYLENKKDCNNELLSRLSAKRADFLISGVETPLPGMNDVHLCRQRLIVSMTVPCKGMPTQKEISDVSDIAGKLKEGLVSVGMWLEYMNDQEYEALLRRFFHLYEPDDRHVDPFTELREQVFGPGDAVQFNRDEINFNDGQYFSKTLSVKHFPSRAGIGLMNVLLGDPVGSHNQITDPYWISATIFYPDQDKKVSQFRFKHAFVTNQTFGGITRLIPMIGYKKQGMDILLRELDGGGGMLCELNFTMTMFSRSHEKLNRNAAAFRAWAASYGFELREDKRILKELYFSLLPMGTTAKGIKNLFRFNTMAVTHAIHNLPIIGTWTGSGAGAASIFPTKRGTTVLFDPYDSETNFNGVLAAGPGSGKSFGAQQFLCDWMAGGARAWVIDQGRSYEKLCEAVGGQFIEFSEDSDICLNPFTNIEDIDEEMDILTAIFAKMAAPEGGLDDYRTSKLQEKIYQAFSKSANKADADLVARQCLDDDDQRVKDIGSMLFPFTKQGPHGRWFNGKANVNMNKDLVVLELQELAGKKALQQVVLIQLFSAIGDQMYHTHGRKKIMLIDEAWSLLKDPLMGDAIEAAYRKVRKHQGGAWLITHSIADLYQTASGKAIINASAWQVILQQEGETLDNAVKNGHMNLDVYTLNLLKSVHTVPGKYAEMMIRKANDWGIVRFVADRFAQILFSTKGWERDYVFDQMKAGRNVVEVIDQLVQEGR